MFCNCATEQTRGLTLSVFKGLRQHKLDVVHGAIIICCMLTSFQSSAMTKLLKSIYFDKVLANDCGPSFSG